MVLRIQHVIGLTMIFFILRIIFFLSKTLKNMRFVISGNYLNINIFPLMIFTLLIWQEPKKVILLRRFCLIFKTLISKITLDTPHYIGLARRIIKILLYY